MQIIKTLDAEISASKKNVRPINVHLYKNEEKFEGIIPFKLEGEYLLECNGYNQVISFDSTNKVEIEAENINNKGLNELNAILTKDTSSLLKAIKAVTKTEVFKHEPEFIVGPPGTGKTKVITKIAEKAIKNFKLLIVAPTNLGVENILERIAEIDEITNVISCIKTKNKRLEKYDIKHIKQAKLAPLEDQISILSKQKKFLLKEKRDLQPIIEVEKSKIDYKATLVANLQKDKNVLKQNIGELTDKKMMLEKRLHSLTSNFIIRNIGGLFTKTLIKELSEEKATIEKELQTIDSQLQEVNTKIELISEEKASYFAFLTQKNQELQTIDSQLQEVNTQIELISEEKAKVASNDLFSDANIVCSTLIHACLNRKIQAAEFDLILIDEASMATIPQLVVLSQALNNEKCKSIDYEFDAELNDAQNSAVSNALQSKFVCIGDPRQLQPIANTHAMKQSIFSLYNVEDIFEGVKVKNTVLLDINYRNHPDIANLSSKLFYGGLLKSAKSDKGNSSIYIRKSKSKMVSNGGSFINYGNMKIIIDQVEKALEKGRRDIGIITPFRKQAELINDELQATRSLYSDADIKVGTIHSFQGQEKEIIIYDLTFSPIDKESSIPLIYQNARNLLNVAMTRAKDYFIVVGDIEGILNLTADNLILKDWIHAIKNI